MQEGYRTLGLEMSDLLFLSPWACTKSSIHFCCRWAIPGFNSPALIDEIHHLLWGLMAVIYIGLVEVIPRRSCFTGADLHSLQHQRMLLSLSLAAALPSGNKHWGTVASPECVHCWLDKMR